MVATGFSCDLIVFLSHCTGQKPLCVCFYMISMLLCSFFFFCRASSLWYPVTFQRDSQGQRLLDTCRIEDTCSALVIVRFICRSSSTLFQRLIYPMQTAAGIRRTECFIPFSETGKNLTPNDAEPCSVKRRSCYSCPRIFPNLQSTPALTLQSNPRSGFGGLLCF